MKTLNKVSKHIVVYWRELEDTFKPSPGLKLLIRGKTFANKNCAFSREDIVDWSNGLEKVNKIHPVLKELSILGTYLQTNKISLVLV